MTDAQSARDTALTSLQQAAAKSGQANRDLLEVGRKLNDANEGLKDAKADLKDYQSTFNSALAAVIHQQGLRGQFSELQAKAGQLDIAMAALNSKMDRTNLGAYLKGKLKDLLNDKETFCAAQNQCSGKGGPVTDKAMSNLFSGGPAPASVAAPKPAGAK